MYTFCIQNIDFQPCFWLLTTCQHRYRRYLIKGNVPYLIWAVFSRSSLIWTVSTEDAAVDLIIRRIPKSLFWPGQEPVDGGAIDQSGKGSDSPSESLSHGTHAKHQVQIFFAFADEIGVFLVHGAYGHLHGHLLDYFWFFF